jgi:hypothetical protein
MKELLEVEVLLCASDIDHLFKRVLCCVEGFPLTTLKNLLPARFSSRYIASQVYRGAVFLCKISKEYTVN